MSHIQSHADEVLDLILDYVLLGLHLEIAIRSARDSMVQGALGAEDMSETECLTAIRWCAREAEHQGQHLREMSDKDFRDMLIGRQMLQELS